MNPLLSLIGPVLDKVCTFIPNPEERQKAQLAAQQAILDQQATIVKALVEADAQQNNINLEEAKSSSLFVAGWRPFIGWICGCALGWQFLFMPIGSWCADTFCQYVGKKPIIFPSLDNSQLYPILFALLGMGGLRTLEKIQGVARDTDPLLTPKTK
jgi:hypothetical protein